MAGTGGEPAHHAHRRGRGAAAADDDQRHHGPGRRPAAHAATTQAVSALSRLPVYFGSPTPVTDVIPSACRMDVSSWLFGTWFGNVTMRPVLKKPPPLPITTYGIWPT